MCCEIGEDGDESGEEKYCEIGELSGDERNDENDGEIGVASEEESGDESEYESDGEIGEVSGDESNEVILVKRVSIGVKSIIAEF